MAETVKGRGKRLSPLEVFVNGRVHMQARKGLWPGVPGPDRCRRAGSHPGRPGNGARGQGPGPGPGARDESRGFILGSRGSDPSEVP